MSGAFQAACLETFLRALWQGREETLNLRVFALFVPPSAA
jgi:hypothetical protein